MSRVVLLKWKSTRTTLELYRNFIYSVTIKRKTKTMTHSKLSGLCGQWFKFALFAVAIVLTATVARAADKDKTIVKIVLDTDYTIPFGDSYYSFDAPQSGVLKIKSTGNDVPRPCTDDTFSEQSADYTYASGAIEMNVVAGTTYYFNAFSLNSTQQFRATMSDVDDKIDTIEVSPVPGSVIDITNTLPLSLQFNKAISSGPAVFSSGENTASAAAVTRNGYASYSIKSKVFEWMKSGAVKAGDKLTVVISDICSSLNSEQKFGSDGTLTLEYYIPEMPTTLSSKSVPEAFLSYWPKGETDGIVSLKYDKQLSAGATATLTFGNIEDDNEYYKETLPVTVSGNTLTIDFTGKIRTPKSMLPNSSDPTSYTSIFLRVSGIKDINGEPCYAEGQSSYGSYQQSLSYENVAKEVVTEFTPKSGADISSAKAIELWIAGKSALLYNGVNFAYTIDGVRKSVVVKNSEITETKENDDEYALTIPVPEEAKNGTAVLVSLDGLQFTDGQDRDITARYNILKPTLLKPETTELALLNAGDEVSVSTNMGDKIGYMLCQISDLNAKKASEAVVNKQEAMTKAADGTFSLILGDTILLQKGHSYAIELTAYRSADDVTAKLQPIDTASIVLTGTADSDFIASVVAAKVGGLSGANAAKGIYTISGTKASDSSDKSAIDRLPRGIYIIDGRKVTVKP